MGVKSVERKLYEAWVHDRGVTLTREDIDKLLTQDDAIQTRICNKAALEAGRAEPGVGGDMRRCLPWKKLGSLGPEKAAVA